MSTQTICDGYHKDVIEGPVVVLVQSTTAILHFCSIQYLRDWTYDEEQRLSSLEPPQPEPSAPEPIVPRRAPLDDDIPF